MQSSTRLPSIKTTSWCLEVRHATVWMEETRIEHELTLVLAASADNGSLYFWDWRTGYNFQQLQTIVQPGSLESEAGIFKLLFDMTGTRLISCEADKTIKSTYLSSGAIKN